MARVGQRARRPHRGGVRGRLAGGEIAATDTASAAADADADADAAATAAAAVANLLPSLPPPQLNLPSMGPLPPPLFRWQPSRCGYAPHGVVDGRGGGGRVPRSIPGWAKKTVAAGGKGGSAASAAAAAAAFASSPDAAATDGRHTGLAAAASAFLTAVAAAAAEKRALQPPRPASTAVAVDAAT